MVARAPARGAKPCYTASIGLNGMAEQSARPAALQAASLTRAAGGGAQRARTSRLKPRRGRQGRRDRQDPDGRPHPDPGGQAHACPAALGLALASVLRRIQGKSRRYRRRVWRSGLHPSDLLGLGRVGQALEARPQVLTGSWDAQQLECQSEPCPHGCDGHRAQGGRQYA